MTRPGRPIAALHEGEGFRSGADERADLLAYIRRLHRNAQTMADNPAGFADQGRERARMCAVIEEYVAQGLHEGEAATEAEIAARTAAAQGDLGGRAQVAAGDSAEGQP